MAERVLITGARAPAALDLARSFQAAGFEAHMADCTPSRMAALSRAATRVHRYPSPRKNFPRFKQAMASLISRLEPTAVIPTCEEVFYLAALDDPRVFAPPASRLRRLHSKYLFAQDLAVLGMATPETIRVQSATELQPMLANALHLVFKPEYSRFGAQTLVGPSQDAVLVLRPSEAAPWVVQERVRGDEVSFYAVSVDSRLVAFSAYSSPWKFEGGAGYAFEPLHRALHDQLLEIASGLAQKLIPRGQFACDVIVDTQGTPWLLECNPRATSGVHLFDRSAGLAWAMLGRYDTPALATGAPKHVGPALWFYGLATALKEGRLREWSERRRRSGDVIGAQRDQAPIVGALIDTVQLSANALIRGKHLTEMATADIEWNGETLPPVSGVRIARVDDDTIAWGADQAGLSPYVRAMAHATPALHNAQFGVSVLQLTDRAFPVVAPAGRGTCWLTSLAVTYGQAARDEVAREVKGVQARLFNALSHLAETLLRLTKADQVVFANHLLFSTSLYGDWTGDDLEPALEALRTAFPDRAIIWRSLNADEHVTLAQRMARLGGRRLLSRIVWRLRDPARDWAPRRDARDDRQLALAQSLRIEIARELSDDDLRRMLSFYDDIYRQKYSLTNPAYGEALLRAAVGSGVLTLRLIRNSDGVLEGFTAEHVYQGTLVNPMLGYDRTLPQSRGLYRVAMAASAERSIAEGLGVNYSAGAGAFKRNRGARPALEFSMIFDDHLPTWRRLSYRCLAWALEALAPMLERIAVK